MNRLYWRSKEGKAAPKNAQFFLQPFEGNSTPFPAEVIDSLPAPADPIEVLSRVDEPNREKWLKMVEKSLWMIDQNILQKVVLARRTTFTLNEAPDPLRIAAALEKRAQGAALFCLELGKIAFLGASPERLFRREKNTLYVDALAGTKKKGEEFSEKETREFQFVEDYLRNSTLCNELEFTPLQIHQTANVQHLYTKGKGILKPGISDWEILKTLHPTPALCGVPQRKALDWIKSQEPFLRGLYGGVIGWNTEEEADTTVCIRCCLIEGTKVHFYTGLGIVDGSDPEHEWKELEMKLALYEGIFPCIRSSIN